MVFEWLERGRSPRNEVCFESVAFSLKENVMKNLEIVQMLAQLATVAVGCYISMQLAQVITMLRRQFVWGAMSSSSRIVLRDFSSRCLTAPPTGFCVWAWGDGIWTLEHDCCEPGHVAGDPPKCQGTFTGERVRTSSVPKS